MIRRTVTLATVVTGALVAVALAQPSPPPPPAPPAPPAAAAKPAPPPKPPAPPKPGASSRSWRFNGSIDDAKLKAELQRGLDEAIAEITSNKHIPAAMRDQLLKTLKQARQSGDVTDLAGLADLARGTWGKDLRKQIEKEVEEALRDAGIDAKLSGKGNGFRIDLGKGGNSWSWDWNDDDDDASPFDDPDLAWLPFYTPGSTPPSGFGPDPRDLDLDLDLDDVQLDAGKIAALEKISADERKVTEPAQRKVEELGRQLQRVVGGANPNQAEIDRLVDAITAEEARIRKARLGALTQARKVVGK